MKKKVRFTAIKDSKPVTVELEIRKESREGKLKSVRLGRAEKLNPEDRAKYNLPEKGLVAIETWEVPTKKGAGGSK